MGFMDNVTGSGVGERDYQNYGLTFLFEPNDRFEALLTVEAFRDEGTLAAFNTNYNVPAGLLPAPPPDRQKMTLVVAFKLHSVWQLQNLSGNTGGL